MVTVVVSMALGVVMMKSMEVMVLVITVKNDYDDADGGDDDRDIDNK